MLNTCADCPEDDGRGTVNGMKQVPPFYGQWAVNKKGPGFVCGYCGVSSSGNVGIDTEAVSPGKCARTRACTACGRTSFIDVDGTQTPGPSYGTKVAHLPPEIERVYEQARASMAANAYMGVALICRTILMHICCAHGAKPRKNFAFYLDYLIDEGLMATHSRDWFAQVTKIGNRAAHRLDEITRDDAERIVDLIAYVLQSLYEHPINAGHTSPIPAQGPATTDDDAGD